MARRYYPIVITVLALLAVLVAGRRRGAGTPPPVVSNLAPTAAWPPSTAKLVAAPVATEGRTALTAVARDLRSGGDAASDRARLQALSAQLAGLGRERAIAVIRDFLATREDAPTHLGFTLGNDGLLTGTPTLRVFLLDLLERLDANAAADLAKTILATPGSADEWAVALRSLARGRPEERDFLAAKTHELLHQEAWRAAPSTGWLEAFDVPVHLGGNGFVPDLSELMQPTNGPTLNHAAFLALDRLASREPASVLAALLDSTDLMAGREASRAGMFARADVQDPPQRALLERYLLDPARSAAELDTFAGVYPNANAFLSANLLTTAPAMNRDIILRHDTAALAVVNGWLADPRFASVQARLERMRARLLEFTRTSH